MGAADIVPGVSGGTVALLVGIYERLVRNVEAGARSLGSVARGNPQRFVVGLKKVEWGFLIPLGVGILTAIGALSALLERLLQERPEEMAGLFFGLVVGSILVAGPMVERWTAQLWVVAGLVAAVAFIGLGLQSGPVADPPLLAYFAAGAIAICAMILPGISGSFLLLMMGMYAAVLGAVHHRDLAVIAVFGLGAVVGLALFSTALGWLLDHHHDPMLAALIGLMAGSLRVLWPWPHGVGVLGDDETPSISGTGIEWPPTDQMAIPVILGFIAFALVVAVSRLAASRTKPAVDLVRTGG